MGRISAVDGLRAVAVATVIAFHFGVGTPGGFLSVDLFFVISGYVITRLLLIEWQRSGSIVWTRFWARRARRLLPAVMVVLLAVQVWLWLGAVPELRATTNDQTLAALTYVSNWYAIFAHVSYWGALVDSTPLTHLWTLAVEEQFYLVWPLLLMAVLALTRSRRVLAAVAGVGAVASYASAAVLFATEGMNRAYLGTDVRSGALFLGVLCALVLTRPAPGPDGSWDRLPPVRHLPAMRWTLLVATVVLALLWSVATIEVPWLYDGGFLVNDVAAALIIAGVVAMPGSWAARFLSTWPILWTGRLSYSLYLWHWPVHVYATHEWAHLDRPLRVSAELIATLALGILSYALVERPTRNVRRPAVLAPALLACGLLVFAGAIADRSAPPVEQQDGVTVHGHT
jgi:peptidoglycan/LPS O-acetylase OafA/YrhL